MADLGCGGGRTLLALRERLGPEVELIGVERREPELEPSLAGDPRLRTVVADLNKPLPFEDASLGAAVCHNTLEALVSSTRSSPRSPACSSPAATSCSATTTSTRSSSTRPTLELTRRLVHAFADTQEEWMDAADGTIGRKLPAIARRAPLEHVETLAWVELDTDLAAGEPGRHRDPRASPAPCGATATTTWPRGSRRGSTSCACAPPAASSCSASTTTPCCCASRRPG